MAKSRNRWKETCESDHEEHCRLADIVKGVHADLRTKYTNGGTDIDELWGKHCEDQQVLEQYANAMHKLATKHWTRNPETRIDWCRKMINEYFRGGGLRKILEKEERRKRYEHEKNWTPCTATNSSFVPENLEQYTIPMPSEEKIILLDVGSCFNPFADFEEFFTVAVDICPAVAGVYKCDFLNLTITEPIGETDRNDPSQTMSVFADLKSPVLSLPGLSFHVVVFSLLLEYLPAPYQRWKCVLNAHKLLMFNGILVIVTPDSHKQHRNASLMKNWKTAIEVIGFKRWYYVKLEHLHCMVFRKTESTVPEDCKDYIEMLKIHQDYNRIKEKNDVPSVDKTEHGQEDAALTQNLLHELPLIGASGDDFT